MCATKTRKAKTSVAIASVLQPSGSDDLSVDAVGKSPAI